MLSDYEQSEAAALLIADCVGAFLIERKAQCDKDFAALIETVKAFNIEPLDFIKELTKHIDERNDGES